MVRLARQRDQQEHGSRECGGGGRGEDHDGDAVADLVPHPAHGPWQRADGR